MGGFLDLLRERKLYFFSLVLSAKHHIPPHPHSLMGKQGVYQVPTVLLSPARGEGGSQWQPIYLQPHLRFSSSPWHHQQVSLRGSWLMRCCLSQIKDAGEPTKICSGSNLLVLLSLAFHTPELKHPEYTELVALWSIRKSDFLPMLIVKTSDLCLC